MSHQVVVESGGLLQEFAMPAIPMTSAQIADDLAARIKAGEYEPGGQLPSYNQLAGIYLTTFGTIARAMVRLRERGVVVGVPGKGVYVADVGP